MSSNNIVLFYMLLVADRRFCILTSAFLLFFLIWGCDIFGLAFSLKWYFWVKFPLGWPPVHKGLSAPRGKYLLKITHKEQFMKEIHSLLLASNLEL